MPTNDERLRTELAATGPAPKAALDELDGRRFEPQRPAEQHERSSHDVRFLEAPVKASLVMPTWPQRRTPQTFLNIKGNLRVA
jgi:hypothetical protein